MDSTVRVRRIAILDTCIDHAEFAQRMPNDGDKFKELLQPLRTDWVFDVVLVKDGVFPKTPNDYDGYVIIGSPMSVNGPEPWIAELLEFIRQVESAQTPMFGACFGHQAIAKALGGKVEKSKRGWGLGVANTHFTKSASWMRPKLTDVELFAAHQEQVTQLPATAEILGCSEHCPVGAFHIGSHVFTTEYHPEMSHEFMTAVIDNLASYLDDETLRRSKKSMTIPTQGKEFAHWIVNFLDQEKGAA